MKQNIAGFAKTFENGKIDRRELMRALGLTATAAIAAGVSPKVAAFADGGAPASLAGGMALKAVAFNHINYQVSDYAKVRDFYVKLLGMKVVYDDGKQCSVECGDPPAPSIFVRSTSRSIARPARGLAPIGPRRWVRATSITSHFPLRILNWNR